MLFQASLCNSNKSQSRSGPIIIVGPGWPAPATIAWGAFLPGTGNVDGQIPTIHIFPVQGCDRFFSVIRRLHGYESETPRASAEFVHDHIHIINDAMGGEECL